MVHLLPLLSMSFSMMLALFFFLSLIDRSAKVNNLKALNSLIERGASVNVTTKTGSQLDPYSPSPPIPPFSSLRSLSSLLRSSSLFYSPLVLLFRFHLISILLP